MNVNVAAGSISVGSVNIKDSSGNNLNSTSNALNSYITNTSLDNHMYVSNNGTTWHHIKADANGVLNTHSMLQDGVGVDLTSTLIGSKQSLDVNVANTASIPVSVSNFPSSTNSHTQAYDPSGGGGYFDITSTNISASISALDVAVKNSVSANITNTSLNTISKTQDGAGNNITSTTNGIKRGMDVIISNSAAVPVSGYITVDNTTANKVPVSIEASNVNLSVNVNDFTGNSITSDAFTFNGSMKNGLDVAIINNSANAVPISGSVSVSNQISGYALDSSITTTNNTLTTTNSTLNTISTTLNTIHNDLDGLTYDGYSSLNVNVANASVAVSGTVDSRVYSSSGATIGATAQSLQTYDYNINNAYDATGTSIRNLLVGKNGVNYVNLSATSAGYLNTNITNSSTTNDYSQTGINMYQILPKVKSYAITGLNNITTADTLMAGSGSNIGINAYQWGKINANKSYWLYTPTGANIRSITYNYIDSAGNDATGTATGIVNSYVALQSNIVCLNNFSVSGSVSITSTDALYITLANSGTTTLSVCSLNNVRYNMNNAIFTVPNNAIALITSIDAVLGTANEYYYMNVWDANGNRTIPNVAYVYSSGVNNMRTAGGGEYGSIGRILTAGETVAFSTGGTTATNKNIIANIKVVYL